MKLLKRPRLTIFAGMVVVALFALLFAWLENVRRARIAAVETQLQAAQDRVQWASRMLAKGYVSKQAVTNERAKRDQARRELERLGAAPVNP